MRALAEQNYYELLEAPPEGTPVEIERAYRIARATYQPSSTAVYSLFSGDECAAILRRIEEAWAVLSDARLRREYDSRLRRGDARPGETLMPAPAPLPVPAAPAREPAPATSPTASTSIFARRPRPAEPVAPPPAPPRRLAEVDLDGNFAPENGVFDGEVLRRIRVSLGIELDEISTITKINEQHLRSIEANQYDVLPAPVYLRGFLKQIARCLSLDPARVADSYTLRMRDVAGRES